MLCYRFAEKGALYDMGVPRSDHWHTDSSLYRSNQWQIVPSALAIHVDTVQHDLARTEDFRYLYVVIHTYTWVKEKRVTNTK